MTAWEMNFDGLVGPTHHYSGLSFGNLASQKHQFLVSHPKKAALQGLEKMALVKSLGVLQGILPPHERPHLSFLRSLGFSGTSQEILEKAFKTSPSLFYASFSSSSMWAANTATFTPSCDTLDKKVHITPANLNTFLHRSLEAKTSHLILKKIFSNPDFFTVHPPLPSQSTFSDEGSANQIRFYKTQSQRGIYLFVFGASTSKKGAFQNQRFYSRQSKEALEALVRLHQIPFQSVVFAKQSQEAIDAGVFHNDVISFGNQSLFLYHEKAFENSHEVIDLLKEKMQNICQTELTCIPIKEKEVSLKQAVDSYLFNSQIIQRALLCPKECQEMPSIFHFLKTLIDNPDIPLDQLYFVDLKESMQNGGGPACLRLKTPLTEKEVGHLQGNILFTDSLYLSLKTWINTFFPDTLYPKDLLDPLFCKRAYETLDALTKILKLGSFYDFQA